jgi:hypothetical protein
MTEFDWYFNLPLTERKRIDKLVRMLQREMRGTASEVLKIVYDIRKVNDNLYPVAARR